MSIDVSTRANELLDDAISKAIKESGMPPNPTEYAAILKECEDQAEMEFIAARDQRIQSRKDAIREIIDSAQELIEEVELDDISKDEWEERMGDIVGFVFSKLPYKLQREVYKKYRTTRASNNSGMTRSELFRGKGGTCAVGGLGVYKKGTHFVLHRGSHKKFRIKEEMLIGTTFEKYLPRLVGGKYTLANDEPDDDLQIEWYKDNGVYRVARILGQASDFSGTTHHTEEPEEELDTEEVESDEPLQQ